MLPFRCGKNSSVLTGCPLSTGRWRGSPGAGEAAAGPQQLGWAGAPLGLDVTHLQGLRGPGNPRRCPSAHGVSRDPVSWSRRGFCVTGRWVESQPLHNRGRLHPGVIGCGNPPSPRRAPRTRVDAQQGGTSPARAAGPASAPRRRALPEPSCSPTRLDRHRPQQLF